MPKRQYGPLGGRPPELEHRLALRLSDHDVSRLEGLAERVPVLPRTTLVRVAMRLGFDALEKNPGLALMQPVEKRGGARTKRGR